MLMTTESSVLEGTYTLGNRCSEDQVIVLFSPGIRSRSSPEILTACAFSGDTKKGEEVQIELATSLSLFRGSSRIFPWGGS